MLMSFSKVAVLIKSSLLTLWAEEKSSNKAVDRAHSVLSGKLKLSNRTLRPNASSKKNLATQSLHSDKNFY